MSSMKDFLDSSHLFGGNAAFIEELYESYLDTPQSVPEQWRDYFDRLQVASGSEVRDVVHSSVVQAFAQLAKQGRLRGEGRVQPGVERKQVYVLMLIEAYRAMGSRCAQLDPLRRQPRPQVPELEPAFYDLTEA